MLDTPQEQIAAQLETIIRLHLRQNNIDVPQLAAIMGLSEWAITGMLSKVGWHIELCFELLEKLHIAVSIQDANDF